MFLRALASWREIFLRIEGTIRPSMAETAVADQRAPNSPAQRLRRMLPWAVAAAILWYLFRRVAVADAWRAAGEARLEVFLPIALAAVAVWFVLESGAFAYLFSRFNAALSWSDARALRGLTYLVTPINWNVGTAAIVLHLRQSKGIGALDSVSSMFFYQTIDGIVLGTLTLVGLWTLESAAGLESLARFAAIMVALQVATLTVMMARRPDWRWLRRARALGIFRTHGLARGRDVAVLSTIRTCYFLGFVLFFWLGTRAFHVDVPFGFTMAATPIILLSAALPITPGGLGTQQAAMLYFFSAHGAEAAILAFALAFPVTVSLIRVLLGLIYIRDLGTLRRGGRSA
jgi:uncharacterized membrane protein YbhN (UPF0104 family)